MPEQGEAASASRPAKGYAAPLILAFYVVKSRLLYFEKRERLGA